MAAEKGYNQIYRQSELGLSLQRALDDLDDQIDPSLRLKVLVSSTSNPHFLCLSLTFAHFLLLLAHFLPTFCSLPPNCLLVFARFSKPFACDFSGL